MRVFVLFCFLFASLASFAQKGGYKQTEYEIEFKKKKNHRYSKRIKSKTRTAYRIFDAAHNLIEWGEYGLAYCKSNKSTPSENPMDSGITTSVISVYRIEDFNQLKKTTFYRYDSTRLKGIEEEVNFYKFQGEDTVRHYFEYVGRKMIGKRTISPRDTEESRYDAIGRLIEEEWLGNGVKRKKAYVYAASGKLSNVVDENGRDIVVNYVPTYDSAGRLIEELILRNSKLEKRLAHDYDYGRHVIVEYDAGGQLSLIIDSVSSFSQGKVLIYSGEHWTGLFIQKWQEDLWGRIKWIKYYNQDLELTRSTRYKYKRL